MASRPVTVCTQDGHTDIRSTPSLLGVGDATLGDDAELAGRDDRRRLLGAQHREIIIITSAGAQGAMRTVCDA